MICHLTARECSRKQDISYGETKSKACHIHPPSAFSLPINQDSRTGSEGALNQGPRGEIRALSWAVVERFLWNVGVNELNLESAERGGRGERGRRWGEMRREEVGGREG